MLTTTKCHRSKNPFL